MMTEVYICRGTLCPEHMKQNERKQRCQFILDKTLEVARLLAQIDREYEAAQQGLFGLSQGASQHQFINNITERIGVLHSRLHTILGDEAMRPISIQSEYISDGEEIIDKGGSEDML